MGRTAKGLPAQGVSTTTFSRTYHVNSKWQGSVNETCFDENKPCTSALQVIQAARNELSMNSISNLPSFHMSIVMSGSYACEALFDFSNFTSYFELSWIGSTNGGFENMGCNFVVNRGSKIDKFHFVNGGVGTSLYLDKDLDEITFEKCWNELSIESNVKNIVVSKSRFSKFGGREGRRIKVNSLHVYQSNIGFMYWKVSGINLRMEQSQFLNGVMTVDFFGDAIITDCHWSSVSESKFNAGNLLNITNSTIPGMQIMVVSRVEFTGISVNLAQYLNSPSYLGIIGAEDIYIRKSVFSSNMISSLFNIQKAVTVQILECTFENNTGSLLTIVDTAYKINSELAQIAVMNSKFIGNVADSSLMYIYLTHNMITSFFNNCTFTNNSGSSIHLFGIGQIVITNSLFSNNSAHFGGALRISGYVLQISTTRFISNQANFGGAIFTTTSSLLLNGKSYCNDNKAIFAGGCIFSTASSLLYGMIGNNTAGYYGSNIGSDLNNQIIMLKDKNGQYSRIDGQTIEIYAGEPLNLRLFISDGYKQSTSQLTSDNHLSVVVSTNSVVLQRQDYETGNGYIGLNNLQVLLINTSSSVEAFQLLFSIPTVSSFVNVKMAANCPPGYSLTLGSLNLYSCQSIPFEIILPSAIIGFLGLTVMITCLIIGLIIIVGKLIKLRKQEKAEKEIEKKFKSKTFVFGEDNMSLPLLDNSLNNDETSKKYTIPISDISITKKIGEGASGVVFLGQWNRTNVAIKQFKTDTDDEEFEREAILMSSLRHPSIVTCYGVSLSSSAKYMIVEYLSNGSLEGAIYESKIGKKKLKFLTKLSILSDICKGMLYLHSIKPNKIIHRDLKCGNILLDKNLNAKVGDFGLSKMVSGNSATMTTNVGTLLYIAPELLSNHHRGPTTKIDVYSFGIIMWELLFESTPFSHELTETNTVFAILMEVVKGHRPSILFGDNFEKFESWIENNLQRKEIEKFGISKIQKSMKDYIDLMQQCWSNDPNERPEFVQITESIEGIIELLSK